MAPQLFGQTGSPRVFAPLIVAAYSGVELESVPVTPSKGEVTPEYTANFPFQKIPGLKDGDFVLFESAAVIEYIAGLTGDKAKLLGSSVKETAQVRQWLNWTTSELLIAIAAWFAPRRGLKPFQKNLDAEAEAAVRKLLGIYDQVLASRTFLVGDRLTAADIYAASAIRRGAEFVLDKSFAKSFPNVFRHYQTVANQETFVKVVGPPKAYIDAPIEPPKAPAKEKAPKEKTSAAPKAAAAAKPKNEEKDDDEDDDAAAAPKAKHPCEALGAPKSFPFDEWKRQYSNNDTPVAIEWLAKNLGDSNDYSFWRATYKYPDELTQTFMSANLIGGFHNRLEGSRKFLFGSAAVYGEKNASAIQGVYMVRGSDYKPVFEVAPDFDSYDFAPLDFSKDRELISQVWSWEGEFDGKPIADGCAKIFK